MLLSAAEQPEKIKLTFPEDDAKRLFAGVEGGRLIMAQAAHLGEARATYGIVTGDFTVTEIPEHRAEKIAAAGAAVRQGEVDPTGECYSVEWDVPTIRNVRTHLLYASMDENIAAGRRASEDAPDSPASRLYNELWEAEHALTAAYEETQGQPYPLPEITVITGPKTY